MKSTRLNCFLIITHLITLALLVIVSVHYITYQDLAEPEAGHSLTEVSWPETRRLLTEGKITSVAQAHDNWWWLYRHDGEPLKTRQASVELVYNAVDQCGDAMCASLEFNYPTSVADSVTEISWPAAIHLIHQGVVKEVFQTGGSDLYITLGNGDIHSAIAPEQGAVIDIVESCQKPSCRELFLMME